MKPLQHGEDRAREERERQLRLRVELLDRPDRHEAPRRRARGHADERHADHGTQRVVELVAPDEAHQTTDDARLWTLAASRPRQVRRAAPLADADQRPIRRANSPGRVVVSSSTGSTAGSGDSWRPAPPPSDPRSASPRRPVQARARGVLRLLCRHRGSTRGGVVVTPRSRSRSKSPRSAFDISSLWLCSFTRRTIPRRSVDSFLLVVGPSHRHAAIVASPRSSVGSTVKAR